MKQDRHTQKAVQNRFFQQMSSRRSRFILWVYNLILLCYIFVCVLMAVWHFNLISSEFYLFGIGFAVICGVVLWLLSFISLIYIWFKGKTGALRGSISLIASTPFIILIVYLGIKSISSLPINDVYTGLGRAPEFYLLKRERENEFFRPVFGQIKDINTKLDRARCQYAKAEEIAKLKPFCDKLPAPITLKENLEDSAKRILQALTELNLLLPNQTTRFLPNENRFEIEAYETSFPFGFTDDIIIIGTQSENGVKIEIRSASRIGLNDFGVNLKRVQSIYDEIINTAIGEVLR